MLVRCSICDKETDLPIDSPNWNRDDIEERFGWFQSTGLDRKLKLWTCGECVFEITQKLKKEIPNPDLATK